MSVLIVLVVFLCVVLAAWSWLRRDLNSMRELPGAYPIIGHSLQLLGDRKHLWHFLEQWQKYATKECDGVVRIWIGPHSIYMVTNPEDCLTLANTCLSKPFFYDFAKEFINNGLITASASVWKSHRKLLNPAFNQQVLNTYVNEMNVQSRKLVTQLVSKVGKDPFDVREFFINYTLSSVTRTSLGLNTKEQTAIDVDYAEAIEDLFSLYCDRFQKVWLHLSYTFDRSAMKRRQTGLVKKLKDIIDPVIRKRKTELANKDPNMYDEATPGKFKPVLDQMLHLSEEQGVFTDDDIREHLDTLVAAAYDTTSSALTFILLAIGSDQKLQERIVNELKEVLKHEDDDLTKHDLSKLVYLEAVIKESMRLYPSVPIIGRKVDTDVKLRNCTLRAGNTCIIGVSGLLRHPMWGADAEQFRPERWLDPASLPDHPSLNATFGVGKRNCIGKLYGMMVMKTALAHILRRYHVTGDINNVVCEFDVVSKPVEGHLVKLTLRT